jgi:hypothetical protein
MKVFHRDSRKYSSSIGSSPFVYICLLIFILLLSITSIAIADQQEELKKSIQIINPRPDFSLSLRLDKGTGATYAPGERIRVYFRVSKNAYVTLFGYDTRGNIRLLFPNQHQRNQYVEANRQYYIDGVVEPGTPAGIEYVQGFATTEPAIITRELERRLEEENFPKMEEGISRFTQRIKGILTALPAQRWVSSEILHYQVLQRSSETGQLRVNSSPEGAEVYLNDRYAGKTPLVMEQLNIGEYVARLEHPVYQTWTRTIQINPDRTAFISADLQRIQQYGSIAIRCNENDARIYLDGQYQGFTEKNKNVLLERVNEGSHDIRVTLSGYLNWSRRIELKPNQRVQLTVNLEKEKRTGSLEITSDVDNALIYLDGDYQLRTSTNRSVTISNLQEGTYELRIVKEGYHDYLDTVRIYAERTFRLNVQMQREYREGAIAVHCSESNAKIFINGTYKATATANQAKIFSDLKEGLYEIAVIKDGYHVWLEETWVYPGETASIFADLVKMED